MYVHSVLCQICSRVYDSSTLICQYHSCPGGDSRGDRWPGRSPGFRIRRYRSVPIDHMPRRRKVSRRAAIVALRGKQGNEDSGE
ncbi:unnamed protein product [Musa acuminata subsp. burmannicoides]